MGLESAVQCAMWVMYKFIKNKAFVHSFINSLTNSFNGCLLSSSGVPDTVLSVGV